MNIAESIRHVLKQERQSVLNSFWKEDVGRVVKDVSHEFFQFLKQGSSQVRRIRGQKLSASILNFKDSARDTFEVLKVFPVRIKRGFDYFKEDLLHELEMQPDPKHRTLFSMKVVGALVSFTVGSLANVRQAKMHASIPGRRVITQFLVSQLIFKLSRLFILRFMEEIEKQLSDEHDLKKLQYFKSIIASTDFNDEDHASLMKDDEAVAIVEALRTYIMTGQRDSKLD